MHAAGAHHTTITLRRASLGGASAGASDHLTTTIRFVATSPPTRSLQK